MKLPSRLLRLVPLAVLAVIAVAAIGCSAEVSVGGGDGASGEEIADEIRSDYEDQTDVVIRSLTCEDVEGDEGEEFKCSGRNSRGVQIEIGGEVTDAGSDGFDYSWSVDSAVAPGVLYERALRREIEARGIALSEVRCPVEIELEVGTEVRCTARDGNGASRGVTLRLTDLDGGFDYSVEGHGPEADGHGAPGESGGSPAQGTQS